MRWMILVAAVVAAGTTTLAAAQDANGFRAIAAGELGLAEQELLTQRRDFPARPELMLNLAHIYVNTARPEQARALYREVLTRRSIAMDLPGGKIVTSHALAQLGLTRLGNTVVAAR